MLILGLMKIYIKYWNNKSFHKAFKKKNEYIKHNVLLTKL